MRGFLSSFFTVAFLFAVTSSAMADNPLLGYWNSNGSKNVVKILKNPSGVIEGRLINVTDAAATLGYQEDEIVIKDVLVNQKLVKFKTAVRQKNAEFREICGVKYLDFIGEISEDLSQIEGKRRDGRFEISKDENSNITSCSYIPVEDWVPLSYQRNINYQPKIEIITFKDEDSLAVGDAFLVQIELKEETSEQAIDVQVIIGQQTMDLSAKRISDYPVLFESDPIEITWTDNKEPWSSVHTSYNNSLEKINIDGWTPAAYINLIQHYLAKAPAEKDLVAAMHIAESIYELAHTSKNPSIWQLTAAGLDAVAEHTVVKEVFETFAQMLMGEFNSHANIKLRSYLDSAHPDIKSQDKNLRQSLVLLKETAFINALKKLYELNRYKQGSGVVSPESFVAFSSQNALKKLRKIDSDQLDNFLLMNGVVNNKAARKELRQNLLATANSLYEDLKEASYRIEISRNAISWHSMSDMIDFGDFQPDQLPGSLRILHDNMNKYESIMGNYPLLAVKVVDERSSFGAKEPLWRVLGRKDRGRTDEQVEQYVDRALLNAETALKNMLTEISAMKTTDELVKLGGPQYKKLQEMASTNFGAKYARSLISYAKGKHAEKYASDYFNETLVDDLLTYGQVISMPYPPITVGFTAIKLSIKSQQTVAAYEDIEDAIMTSTAGFGSHAFILKAHDKFQSRVNDLSFEVVFGAFDVAAAMEFKAARALRAAKAAGEAGEELVMNTIKLSSEEIEKELLLNQKFYNKIQNRKRLTALHKSNSVKTRNKITSNRDKIISAEAEDNINKLNKLKTKHEKLTNTLKGHFRKIASSEKKLTKILEKGPKIPDSGLGVRIMNQGTDVEKGATITFFEAMMERFPQYITQNTDGAFLFSKIEYRFKGWIVDGNGNKLRQKPTVNIYKEVDGKLVKSTEINRHNGRKMEYDRIIIDHHKKIIYLEDIARSPDKKHLQKTWGYFEGLKTMFKKEIENGYTLAMPRDVHYGQMQNPFNAVSPSGKKYEVVVGKGFRD